MTLRDLLRRPRSDRRRPRVDPGHRGNGTLRPSSRRRTILPMPRPETEFESTCLPLLGDCHAFALSLTRNLADADDLVQETFLKAQRAFASFQRGTNAKAWLFTVLRRLQIDRLRRARVRPAPLAEAAL